MWVSRVQRGTAAVTVKIPLALARGLANANANASPPAAATSNPGATGGGGGGVSRNDDTLEKLLHNIRSTPTSTKEINSECSDDEGGSARDSDKEADEGEIPSLPQWDLPLLDGLDEYLATHDDEETGDEDPDIDDEPENSEDGLQGTELEAILARVQRIIEVNNVTAQQRAVTTKQKREWWETREYLDNKMKEAVCQMEEDVLGWRKAIFVAPPSSKATCEALHEAARSLALQLELDMPPLPSTTAGRDNDGDGDGDGDGESEKPKSTRTAKPRVTRAKSKAPIVSKLKNAAAPVSAADTAQRRPTRTINCALLEVCLGATPFLSDSQIADALATITGEQRDFNKWVMTFRKAYEDCVQKNKKSTLSSSLTDERQPILLALDSTLQRLPWESMPCLDLHSATRIPSLLFAQILLTSSATLMQRGINPKSAYYMLNAEGDLSKTQARCEEKLRGRVGWKGLTGARPTPEECQLALSSHDLFVYCGHGSGEQYVRRDLVARLPRCAVGLLMGCSSGQLRDEGDFEALGMATSFLLARSPSVVGNLWDVTDGDLDSLTLSLLDHWLDLSLPLPVALAKARLVCKFRYLVAAATVCYGLPVVVAR